jgi:protein phosphatase
VSAILWVGFAVLFVLALIVVYASPPTPETPPSRTPSMRPKPKPKAAVPAVPRIEYEEEDASVDPTKVGAKAEQPVLQAAASMIVFDKEATIEEPTQSSALILVHATAQTDRGKHRRANEDALLVDEANSLYVVADGMGGYRGGQIASTLAVETIGRAYSTNRFDGQPHGDLPRRGSELARAIQMANVAIRERAQTDQELSSMGTTVCAARFSPRKQRLYVGHVGDSRLYRMRGGVLKQMTADHTMKDHGAKGADATHLSRAVGVWPLVPIDIVLAKPLADDAYLLCSDGLTKMVPVDDISKVLATVAVPSEAVDKLIQLANAKGGLDNITAILVRVTAPGRS